MRVIAAMSGGVDSAVTAARLVEEGHDVLGVTLTLGSSIAAADGFLPGDPTEDARRAAESVGIPFEVWDAQDHFREQVVDYFVDEYAAGRTPNPCLRCNQTTKFPLLLDLAIERGFDAVATGHYARLTRRDGIVELRRGEDSAKDQSYVLGVLTQAQLQRCLFPLYGMSKDEVRAEAARRGLSVADKPDSLDICFIPDGDTAGFLRARIGERAGVIVDTEGHEIGQHRGSHQYTVGQRKGLRLGRPAADGRPRYVVAVHSERNEVVVGPREALAVRVIECGRPSWTMAAPSEPVRCLVQVRAHGRPMPAVITLDGETVTVALDEPAYGIAPGQTAVFYDDDLVLGAGLIVGTA